MKILYTKSEFEIAKGHDNLLLQCYCCSGPFLIEKRHILYTLKHKNNRHKYCSTKCMGLDNITIKYLCCSQCGKSLKRTLSVYVKSKSKNFFCNASCAATYNNKHKTAGTRRSKLEAWLEEQLTTLYPKLDILFNDKSVIDSELDIYIPSLNIAFEINGIFHYEPIYGVDKLSQIQNNDISKSKDCHDAKIDLCTIDASAQKYFKPKTSQKYLDIIIKIIKSRSTS